MLNKTKKSILYLYNGLDEKKFLLMKIKSLICFFFLIVIAFCQRCVADKLEKGFERLRIFDYFNAKDLFEQSLGKRTAGAAYGLSVIYSLNNNPFYNLDSARHYILVSDSGFLHTSEKEKKNYQLLGVTSASIHAQRDSICEKAFEAVSSASTVEKFDTYITNYSFCTEVQQAEELRNAVAYMNAKAQNTSGAYKKFLDSYHAAKEYNEAVRQYEKKVYEETTAENSISSYERYLSIHPGSAYKMQAENMIYALSAPHKTIEEYTSYLKKYPSGSHREEAWREIFKLYTKDYNEQVLENFKKQYPEYPFKNELENDFQLERSFFLPFRNNKLWGFINEDGKEMIKPEYEEVSLFSEGLAAVQKNGKYGYINKSGKMIIPFVYDDAESFKNNSAIVTKNDKSGLINRSGEELIPLVYDNMSDPSGGFYVASLNEKSGYITKSGNKLMEFVFDFAGDFRDGYAIAGTDEKFGLLNNAGSFVIEQQYEELMFLSNGLLKAKQNDLWGIIDTHGALIAPFIYDAIGDFSQGRSLVMKNKKCGFIDEQGKEIIAVIYPFQESFLTTAVFKNGFVALRQKLKAVILDSLGTKITLPGYENTGLPSGELIPVRKNKKWGFADMNGKLRIPCIYEDASSFENGYAKIKIKKLAGIIDESGKEIISPAYEDILFKNNFFVVRINGKSGLISKEGAVIFPCEYDRLEFLSDKIVSVSMNEHLVYKNVRSVKVIWEESN